MPAGLVLLIAAGVLALAALAYWSWRREQARTAALSVLCSAQGWTMRTDAADLVARFRGRPFGTGSRRRAPLALEGRYRGRQVAVFDYRYVTESGSGDQRRRQTHSFTVAAVVLPGPAPRLEVAREHLGHKLLGAVGFDDLALESEQFNQTFHLGTDTPRFAYDVLSPITMEWLLTDPRARALPLRFEGADLRSWQAGQLTAERVLPLVDYCIDVLDQVPGFVWKDAQR